jgi:uncharacterized protein (UPF0261 family)
MVEPKREENVRDGGHRRDPRVLVIATLDTKLDDVTELVRVISEQGATSVVMDTSTRADDAFSADVGDQLHSREHVAQAGGHTIDEVSAMDRGEAASAMRAGVGALTAQLVDRGEIDGAVCLGGAGAHLAQSAFQALPLGFPKLVVSPLASGDRKFEPYVGLRDVAVLHSVADIAGVNALTSRVYREAAGYIVGAARASLTLTERDELSLRTVAISMNGNTTPALTRAKELLEREGLSVVSFHANGVGGRALEDFVGSGSAIAVLDFTTTELAARLVGGLMDPGPSRMEAAGRVGLPQVLVPGCVDFITSGRWEQTEQEFPGRKLFGHNPELTLVRLTSTEMAELGAMFAVKASRAIGPTVICVPTRGFSVPDREGGPFWDPAADQAFIDRLSADLDPKVELDLVDAHVNDPDFVDQVVGRLTQLIARAVPPVTTTI